MTGYKIKEEVEIEIKPGDIIQWKTEKTGEKILLVVVESTNKHLYGIALKDTRKGFLKTSPKTVIFGFDSYKYRLKRLLKAEEVNNKLDLLLAKY